MVANKLKATAKKKTRTPKKTSMQKKAPTPKAKGRVIQATDYTCELPPAEAPYGLKDIVNKIIGDSKFAEFFAEVVCAANAGDQRAIDCVEKYYQPTPFELRQLCIKSDEIATYTRCTDKNRLIDALLQKHGRRGFR